MKKFIYKLGAVCLALLPSLLVSCSNDDAVTISKKTQIRVNPATVLENFTFQLNAGDLDGVSNNEELRVSLFVYDEDGILINSFENKLRNYLTISDFEINLDAGKEYTAIAITDVIKTDDYTSQHYLKEVWGIKGEQNISTLEISYLPSDPLYQDYGQRGILGVGSTKLTSGVAASIDVKAAGALICSLMRNIHEYNDVSVIWSRANRNNGFYKFESDGEWISNPDTDLRGELQYLEPASYPDSYGIYTYSFIMPQTNYVITTYFYNDDFEVITDRSITASTIESQKEYFLEVILDSTATTEGGVTITFSNVTGQYYGSSRSDNMETDATKTIEKDRDEIKDWKVIDLLNR